MAVYRRKRKLVNFNSNQTAQQLADSNLFWRIFKECTSHMKEAILFTKRDCLVRWRG